MSTIKSTNVRIKTMASRLAFAGVARISTRAAAALASRRFLATPARPARPALDVLSEARRFDVAWGRERLAAWSWGTGAKTVLLVHGWGGRAHQMRSFVHPFVQAGYRVVAFDAPGHGLSTGAALSLPELAGALRAVSDVVGPIDAIVAHSFGAAATCLAVARGFAVGRAVLIGSPAAEQRWFERFCGYLGLSSRVRDETQREIERRVGAPFSSLEIEALGPALTLPLLVVHDRDDREVPWEDGARIARAAAQATLLTTEQLGHRRILRDAEVIARSVSFISGQQSAPNENDALQRELFDRSDRWTHASAA
jgi:pimeloyl-ACP methyl ester carboxylesterase